MTEDKAQEYTVAKTDEGSTGTAVALSESQQLMQMISTAAMDSRVDPAKLNSLLDVKIRMMDMQAVAEFNHDFQNLETHNMRVKKNGVVEYMNKDTKQMEKAFNFATWEDMDAVIRPLLRSHGFRLSFDTEDRAQGGFYVIGTLHHASGHKQTAKFPCTIDSSGGKNNLQGAGSSLSYGKRYVTEMLLNIVREGEDDDGARGGMTFIDEAKIAILKKYIAETDTEEANYCDFLGVTELANLQEKDYPKAVNALMLKKKQMAGAKK